MSRHTRFPALTGAVVIVAVALFGTSSAAGSAPVPEVSDPPQSRPDPTTSPAPLLDRGPSLKETGLAMITSASATTLVALSGVGGLIMIAPYLRRKARLVA